MTRGLDWEDKCAVNRLHSRGEHEAVRSVARMTTTMKSDTVPSWYLQHIFELGTNFLEI